MYEDIIRRLRKIIKMHKEMYGGSTEESSTIEEAANAIEELQKALDAMNNAHNEGYDVGYCAGRRDYELKWIPVVKRLPEEDAVCILTNGVSNAIGYRGKVFGFHLIWTDYLEEKEVTHWMPLPKPPKEEN